MFHAQAFAIFAAGLLAWVGIMVLSATSSIDWSIEVDPMTAGRLADVCACRGSLQENAYLNSMDD